ncbi:putative negative regulation of gluconeogenesis [Rosellinia necatrix]|uniref:Putative negative regulation of gluconeogenesis n=1 Tax=Rosellinia necatrix TaxID=77044 RepID=A0A1W2TH60_ROSNE|nr:putative negative regulation of gluconeogenesis [Rosellinia necatrix]
MGDHEGSKLDHESHLLLDQPLLQLPVELLRKNLRSARFEVEKDGSFVKETLKKTATDSVSGRISQADVVKTLDSMIARMRGVKRKLTAFSEEENRLHRHEDARAKHLAELYGMYGVEDVKYEAWSRTRLDRLLTDYLLRQGYVDSARALAKERGIELLVDVDTFEQMNRIRQCLLGGSVQEALAWCTAGDTKKELRKMDSNLEFMLRYQQYIEIVRNRSQTKPDEALSHARKHLLPYRETYPEEVLHACGLLAMTPDNVDRVDAYRELYAPARWQMLADLFTTTHNSLLSLPSIPLLHIALSSGLSALKTPACHSIHPNSAAAPSHHTSLSLATSVCPICSTELNELARNVPHAFYSKSHVEPDLLLLPNGRAYGKARLEECAKKAGLPDGQVKDLRTGEIYGWDALKKVYIS